MKGINAPLPSVDRQTSAFGELSIAEVTPVVQLQFAYNINTRIVEKRDNNSGSVTQASDHAIIASGSSSSSGAILRSIQPIKYNTGQGGLIRFTAKFSAGVANNTRGIGVGDESDGYFFGYNGTAFGILRRNGGSPNIRTLTITTAGGEVDSITITLDGETKAVDVTNAGGDKAVTANEIANADYSDVGAGWDANAVGDTVVFTSWDAEDKNGAFTLTDATSAVGTFAETVAGVAPTDTWIAQTAWNVDTMDGSGASRITLDPTKGNVYQIRYQWLGYGAIRFYIEHDDEGDFHLVHEIKYANANTSPSISNPTLPLCVFSINSTSTTSSTISTGSIAGFVEGRDELIGIPLAASNNFVIGNVVTEEPVITIRLKEVFAGRLNRIRVQLTLVTEVSAMENAKTKTIFRAYIGAIPTNGTSYSDVDSSNSAVEVDVSATDFVGGELQSTFILGQTDREILSLSEIENFLVPGATFMITAQPTKAHANNEVSVSLNWKELF